MAKTKDKAKIKLVVGHGKPFQADDIKRRHQQFIRQQREGKHKVHSLVGRAAQTGYQERIKGVEYKRGVRVAKSRLEQLMGHRQYEVITDEHGKRIEKAVTSSWVKMIHLVMFNRQPALAVSFHDGFTALYTTSNIRDYEAMARAASKGKYVWAALYHGRPGHGAPYISIGF